MFSEAFRRPSEGFRRASRAQKIIDFAFLDSLGNLKLASGALLKATRSFFLPFWTSQCPFWTSQATFWTSRCPLLNSQDPFWSSQDPFWLPQGSILQLQRTSRALGKPCRTDFRKLIKTIVFSFVFQRFSMIQTPIFASRTASGASK